MSDENPKCKDCGRVEDDNPAHASDYTGEDKHVFIAGETSGPGKDGEPPIAN
jgi:hypothetical protein